MAKSSNYWDKRALKRLTDTEKLSKVHIKRIKRIYNEAYKDIDREINKIYKRYSTKTGLDVTKLKELLTRSETEKLWDEMKRQGLDNYILDNYKARISRLEQIQAQIYAKAKLIYPKEELEHTMAYKGVINDSYYKAVYDTQMGTGLNFAFSKIDDNTITALLSERWSGKNYSQRIWDNTNILADSLSEVLGGAMLSGQSIAKTSKQIRDRFNVSQYYAERLIRTETNHFNNQADAMAYEKMGVEYYVFVSVLDDRTSDKCQNMDGKKFAYKDKQEGVNYPPLHPNCRSKTRGYVDEEVEKSLQRRARNPKTGKNELIPNMTYKEWAEKNGIVSKTKVKPKIDINTLPTELNGTAQETKNTSIWVDFINNRKNADPKVVKVYSLYGKIKNYYFKVSHGVKNAISYKIKPNNTPYDITLNIPKLKADALGDINTAIHENMHLIDLNVGFKKPELLGCMNRPSLVDTALNTSADMSDDVVKLFVDFNNECIDVRDKITNAYRTQILDLTNSYRTGDMTYASYKRKLSSLNKKRANEIDATQRTLLGGNVEALQDIYDALSRGKFRDSGAVKYGHGSRYYKSDENVVVELVANYSTLAINRPDLIKILKRDKPELMKELDKYMEDIIKEYGG